MTKSEFTGRAEMLTNMMLEIQQKQDIESIIILSHGEDVYSSAQMHNYAEIIPLILKSASCLAEAIGLKNEIELKGFEIDG